MSDIKVLYEDINYIGFFKPPNIPTTYKSIKNNLVSDFCFINKVKENYPYLFSFFGHNDKEGGLLYRLDNETSGLLLFAKNIFSFKKFVSDKNLKKIYIAKSYFDKSAENIFLKNILNKKEICIDFPIIHKSSKKMFVLKSQEKINFKKNKIFKTYVKLIDIDNNILTLHCMISNGIRHQIRVHLSSIGLPICGDKLYKKEKDSFDNLQLYCVGIRSNWLNIYVDDFIL